jgi:hypothetical protein
MDLLGIGRLLAMSDRPGINELACVKFRYEFGRDSVYTIPQHSEQSHEKHQISGQTAGRILFGGERSMHKLQEMFQGKVKTRTTEITENYTYAEYLDKHPDRIVLFITTKDGRIKFPLGEDTGKIVEGDRITALVHEDST